MGTSISTNLNSLITQESYRRNSEFQAATIQRLSSGYRINSAGDDPAGLALANRFRADTAALTQGVRNLNDGVSRLQIIDGGMANISQVLDRLKVLAAQSASAAFVGDRHTLDSEFQTLLGEIDRQAQSIGLESNGQFAQTLTVAVGRTGTGAGSTIGIDLSNSAVDAKGLGLGGLKGMQAVAGNADIGLTSPTHTVAQIVADPNNTSAVPGYTDFYVSGPGFSGIDAIKLHVNLQGVTTLDGLAAAVNGAIQVAASGTTAEAAALKAAAVTASAYNGQQLAFNSTDTPFQVKAGDVMASALMGNLNGTSGNPIATTIMGASTALTGTAFTPTNVTVRISGGSLASPVDITLDSSVTTIDSALADLTNKIAGQPQLQAAGITVSGLPGEQLTFTDARGEAFNVMASGDTANALGLGSFLAGNAGEADYLVIQGNAYDNTTASGIAHLEFSINGGAAITIPDIDLAGGDATPPGSRTGTDLQKTLNDAFASSPALAAAQLTAAWDGTRLTISSGNNTYFRVNAGTSDPTADIGFGTSGSSFSTPLMAGVSSSVTTDSSGASSAASLTFTPMAYGSESQTISFSANDLSGNLQTTSITIQNNVNSRTGGDIDQAIAAINKQLSQATDPLPHIVAVKENVGGQEQIGFLSSLRSFTVSVGASTGGGINAGAAVTEQSAPLGALVNVSVDTQKNALQAVAAVAEAVSALGAAQAVVGKAENQLAYAINLSQSQITNFSSGESRIRDTDVAADAANLSKSQILVQASVAAMSQANSTAQAVLALLKS